jgi:hypothetical protein
MAERFAALRNFKPPEELHILWVEMDEEALHMVDGVFGMSDGVANVRREYREIEGRKFFKIFVAHGCLDEALETLERLKKFVRIGEVRIER